MSNGTQESDGAVSTKNPIFEVIVHSCLDCTIKVFPQSRLVFRVRGAVQAFEWDRALAGIEAIEAKSISTLLIRNLHDVFGEGDPARRRTAIDEIYK